MTTKTKIVPTEEAVRTVHTWQQSGLQVVMTNGCFDIMHIGHIRYLTASKQLGDRLIVAVNSDDSVKRLKGPERPVNNLDDRMEILAALACVDLVVSFDTDTPQTLIENVNPDILTKGGDYTVDQIAGAAHVLEHGGDVVIIDLVTGYSSTSLIEKSR